MKIDTIKNRTRFTRKRFSLLIFFSVFVFMISSVVSAKNETEQIMILDVSISPEIVQPGQIINFSASYSTEIENEQYQLSVCRSKKMNTRNECTDGTWCASSLYDGSTLSCQYTTSVQDRKDNSFYAFVCNQEHICSLAYPGNFMVSRKALGLEVPRFAEMETMKFSFDTQISTGKLGDIKIITAENREWSLDVSSEDWQSEDGKWIDYNGNGNTEGQMTVNLDKARVEYIETDEEIVLGRTDSFSKKTKNINIASGNKQGQNGSFILKNIEFIQFIPGNQPEGNYKTKLTFTIS